MSKCLAENREKRLNAGSKMSQLLDAEEEDDFYKTTYGGFDDEANDNDYTSADSDSADDVDSDFSIDENDEPISDEDNEEEGRRRRSRKSVYREPKRETNNSITNNNRKVIETKPQLTVVKPQTAGSSGQRVRRNELKSKVLNKKSFRESTRRNARETELRVKIAKKESEARKKSSRRWDNECRQLTQSEMLREAKKTEALNLKSLERYQKLELEKSKKNKVVKEVAKGPFVRYQSVAMPLVEEINEESNVNENESSSTEPTNESKQCSRTFISFTDEETFKSYFPDRKPPQPKQKLFCPISHLPGRYYDPVTLLPYSNAATFRAMREAYYKQLEQLGDTRQPEVAKWINWRRKTTAQRASIQPRIIRIIK